MFEDSTAHTRHGIPAEIPREVIFRPYINEFFEPNSSSHLPDADR